MDGLFGMEFERTEFSDGNYAIVGRALAYAQKFEGDFKALRALAEVETAEPDSRLFDDDASFGTFVTALHKEGLYKLISGVVERLRLPRNFDETLHLARRCRNEIAHEMCLGIQGDIESDQGRKRLVGEISDRIRRIAEAHLLVLAFAALLSHEALPRKGYAEAYCGRVVEWVCSTEG